MNPPTPTDRAEPTPAAVFTPSASSAVRRNAFWAAGAAAIMLWYGFGSYELVDPSAGELIFVYILRLGGALMALSALLSLSGMRAALLFDVLVSVGIGLAMILDAPLLYSTIPRQAFLNVLFGLVFLHSAFRNWEEYRTLGPPMDRSGLESDGLTG